MEVYTMARIKQPFSLYQRKRTENKPIFYCRFRKSDDTYTSGKNTGQTSKAAAIAWAFEYLKKGDPVIRENITLSEYGKDFFDYGGTWATDLKISGKRISERQAKDKQSIFDTRVNPYN